MSLLSSFNFSKEPQIKRCARPPNVCSLCLSFSSPEVYQSTKTAMQETDVSLSLPRKYFKVPKSPSNTPMSLLCLFLSHKSIQKSKTAIEATHVSPGQKGLNTAFKNSASLKMSPLLHIGNINIRSKHGSNPYMSDLFSFLSSLFL